MIEDLAVDGAGGQQFPVSPLGSDAALVQDQYLIRVKHGADALSHHEHRFPAHHLPDRLLDMGFGFNIHGAGAVIQDQVIRMDQKRPRGGQALLLAAGEIDPAFLHHRIVAFGKAGDEIMNTGSLSGSNHLRLARVGAAVPDVIPNAAAEENAFLRGDAHAHEQAILIGLAQVHSIDFHFAQARVVKPGD